MKRDFVVFLLISFFTLLFWRGAFFNFFAQDDFIFIKHFSQNSLLIDIENSFGKPEVTHWRPLHNLYFLISGNLFGKNYYLYHLLIITIHIATSFLIYKIVFEVWSNFKLASLSSLIYALHPTHFVAMYWISGSAINIGFYFLSLSLYLYLQNRKLLAFLVYSLALMASETMALGIVLFYCVNILKQKRLNLFENFKTWLVAITIIFVALRLLSTSSAAFEIYQFELSPRVFLTIKYYILRTLGFAETSGDLVTSILLIGLITIIIWRSTFYLVKEKQKLIFPLVAFSGFFPFILLPDHLSPHYIVLPVFGFALLFAWGLSKFRLTLMVAGFLIFMLVSFFNIKATEGNSWVIQRSKLAKEYILKIRQEMPTQGTQIVFENNRFSSSREAYIALGGVNALDLMFRGKSYTSCFSFIDPCLKDSKSLVISDQKH